MILIYRDRRRAERVPRRRRVRAEDASGGRTHPSAPMEVKRNSTPQRNASCSSCGRQTVFGSETTETAVRLLPRGGGDGGGSGKGD